MFTQKKSHSLPFNDPLLPGDPSLNLLHHFAKLCAEEALASPRKM
jgi:hypothetical protein